MSEVRIDCVVFGYDNGNLKVLLSKENKGVGTKWGLISGVKNENQDTDDAVLGLLNAFGTCKNIFLKPLKTAVDNPKIVKCFAVINIEDYKVNFGAVNLYQRWCNIKDVPDLILDHNQTLDYSWYQLGICVQSPSGFNLLPEKFTLLELMNLYQEILGVETDKLSFGKNIVKQKVILPLNKKAQDISQKTDKLYKFNTAVYNRKDFVFDFHQ